MAKRPQVEEDIAEAAEAVSVEDGPESPEPEPSPEEARLAELERERDEYLDLAQRTRAELENFRKRSARDSQEAERRGRAHVARGLVPAV
ncbi:MAG: nucleotide exchange factor GrpE, partial [Actinomycetota bacterium]|nr:nucleotide exchange factor GrpE [Actinomycetota bacterium]